MPKRYKISVLPGDGIGKEVIPEAVRVMYAAKEIVGGIHIEDHTFDCGGEYYLREGREWSVDGENFTKSEADAILFGAVGTLDSNGDPVRLPDGNHAGYNIVIGLRLNLELYANTRPVKLYEGVPTPLGEKTHEDIDMVIVRENTEGLYVPARGNLAQGSETELAVDLRVISRKGAERVIDYSFRLADNRNGAPSDAKKRVTCVDKSNLLAGCQLFRKVFDETAARYSKIEPDYAYVDAWTLWALRKPEYYDVVVAPNMFGDIISDLGGGIQGGLGMAPSGNIGDKHAMFEPVHGSAPDIEGQSKANPIASILSVAMMYDWLGTTRKDKYCLTAANLIREAVASVLRDGKMRTPDICLGQWKNVTPSSTGQVTDAVLRLLQKIGTER
ncbi:MAG: isocitrate/isopropylmalate dehydrogenase family protein [Candidatus Thorarchaeota archaeon]|jgi:3-isopropylmalate dehydrogenase